MTEIQRIRVEMELSDLVAILCIAEVLAEHLESCENRKSLEMLPSDRVRGAISTLTRERDGWR